MHCSMHDYSLWSNCSVFFSWFTVDMVLFLFYSVVNPIETHIYWMCSILKLFFIYYTKYLWIILLYGCYHLCMTHISTIPNQTQPFKLIGVYLINDLIPIPSCPSNSFPIYVPNFYAEHNTTKHNSTLEPIRVPIIEICFSFIIFLNSSCIFHLSISSRMHF